MSAGFGAWEARGETGGHKEERPCISSPLSVLHSISGSDSGCLLLALACGQATEVLASARQLLSTCFP